MPSSFSDILLSKGIISEDQLNEANRIASDSGKLLHEELLRLGYAAPNKIMKAVAKANGMPFVDLDSTEVAETVIELVPESVARENTIMPYQEDGARVCVRRCLVDLLLSFILKLGLDRRQLGHDPMLVRHFVATVD